MVRSLSALIARRQGYPGRLEKGQHDYDIDPFM